jgi:hypothetical protein
VALASALAGPALMDEIECGTYLQQYGKVLSR